MQVSSIASRSKRELVANIVALAKIGKLYGLPTVLASVNVKSGINQPTIHQITDVLPGVTPINRTAINAWEDTDFVTAVKATGRKKLIMAALWTEVCLVHPALDAMKEGFEVYPVVDAVGGTSLEAHEAGLQRIIQAGAAGGKGATTTTSGAPAAPAVVSDVKRNGIDDTTLTIANYWPNATTLFDYIRRAMPWTSPRTLTDDQVYALTAYILAQDKLIDAKEVINAQTLPKVQMPNRNGFMPRFPERMPPG